MHILYILDTYPSVSETFIAREIEALRRHGFTIEVWALHAQDPPPEFVPPMVAKVTNAWRQLAGGGRRRYFQDLGATVWRQARAAGFFKGVEHIHSGWASHPAYIAWGMANEAGLPWSLSAHARDIFVDGHELAAKLDAAVFATCCTQAGVAELEARAPGAASKIVYAPHGLELPQFPFKEEWEARDTRLLSVGRLVEKKGHATLLQGVAELRQMGKTVHLSVVGDGPLNVELKRLAGELGLEEYVHWYGSIPPDIIPQIMEAANCFVAPHVLAGDGDRDGLPNTVLEAAACGLPLVTTTVGSLTDFVDDQVAALCPPHDAGLLAAAILRVFDQPQATEQRRRTARRRVEERFDIERNIDAVAKAFTGKL